MSLAHKTNDELVEVQFGGVEIDAKIARNILQSRGEGGGESDSVGSRTEGFS